MQTAGMNLPAFHLRSSGPLHRGDGQVAHASQMPYDDAMKPAALPSICVEPELRDAIEAHLAEGESLSDFIESAVRDGLRRRVEDAFLARGRAAMEEWRRTGVAYSTEEVFSAVSDKLEKKIAQAYADGRIRRLPPPPEE